VTGERKMVDLHNGFPDGARDLDDGETDLLESPPLSARLERLLQAAKVYVYTVHYDHGNVVATRHSSGCQAVTGYLPEDYERDPSLWITMVYPDDCEEVCRKVMAAERAHKATRIEHRIVHRDGTVRWVRNTMIPSYRGADLVRSDGLIEDISDQKHAERSLMHHTMQLTAAQEIQRRLLPQSAPRIPGTDIAGGLFPAEYAAGDFFDFLVMPDGSPAFVIGDVSGHGFGPALLMSLTHTLIRILTEIENDIDAILSQVNDFLVKETQDDRFVTLFFARYDGETKSFAYASAGHPPAYVVNGAGDLKARLPSTSFPLGVIAGASFPVVNTLTLARKDVMLMLTDGTLETPSPDQQPFGEARTIQLLQRHRGLSASSILDTLHRQVRDFSKRDTLVDDVTAVVLKIL
jgi:PAS domain S-box-containing protein